MTLKAKETAEALCGYEYGTMSNKFEGLLLDMHSKSEELNTQYQARCSDLESQIATQSDSVLALQLEIENITIQARTHIAEQERQRLAAENALRDQQRLIDEASRDKLELEQRAHNFAELHVQAEAREAYATEREQEQKGLSFPFFCF